MPHRYLPPFGCEKGDSVSLTIDVKENYENAVLAVRYKTSGIEYIQGKMVGVNLVNSNSSTHCKMEITDEKINFYYNGNFKCRIYNYNSNNQNVLELYSKDCVGLRSGSQAAPFDTCRIDLDGEHGAIWVDSDRGNVYGYLKQTNNYASVNSYISAYNSVYVVTDVWGSGGDVYYSGGYIDTDYRFVADYIEALQTTPNLPS